MMKSAQSICILSTLSITLLLSACVSTPTAQQSLAETTTPLANETHTATTLATKSFSEDSLYQLLVADVALTRGQFETALKNYLIQARETRDLGIIQLTNSIANHQRNADAILESALLWVEQEPDQEVAHRTALQAYALHKKPLDALQHAYWLYQNNNDIESFLAVTAIAEGAKHEIIPQLMEAYRALELGPKKKPITELAVAILFREMGDLDAAVSVARHFLTLMPDHHRGLLLLAQVLHQQDNVIEATNLLADALQRIPDDRNVRLQYARLLTLLDRSKAIVQFERLHEQDPNDQTINFLLGLLQLNQGNEARASDLFQQASADPSVRADAQYHLATIAERNGNFADALIHYRRVKSGRNYLAAAARATALLAQGINIEAARNYLQRLRQQQPDMSPSLIQLESNLLLSNNQNEQAIELLSSGLEQHPNDAQLLYARSMVAEQQHNFALAEQDLRALLAQDEDNSTALNALGYTMIMHTDRSEEAHRLIKRAYLLNPGDPAIIDSMGWVLFILGEAEQALAHLEKAMALLPDPEIAAHLGEVQWFLGNKQAALQTWRHGLEQAPNHPAINSTMQRLGADAATTDIDVDSIPVSQQANPERNQ